MRKTTTKFVTVLSHLLEIEGVLYPPHRVFVIDTRTGRAPVDKEGKSLSIVTADCDEGWVAAFVDDFSDTLRHVRGDFEIHVED